MRPHTEKGHFDRSVAIAYPTRRCSRTTGAASTLPLSHRSTPTLLSSRAEWSPATEPSCSRRHPASSESPSGTRYPFGISSRLDRAVLDDPVADEGPGLRREAVLAVGGHEGLSRCAGPPRHGVADELSSSPSRRGGYCPAGQTWCGRSR